MTELFDLIAGSETGAIIATTLALPTSKTDNKPRFYADTSTKWFEEHVDTLYHDKNISVFINALITILLALAGGYAVFIIFDKCYHYEEFEEIEENLKTLIKGEKKKIMLAKSGKDLDDDLKN